MYVVSHVKWYVMNMCEFQILDYKIEYLVISSR